MTKLIKKTIIAIFMGVIIVVFSMSGISDFLGVGNKNILATVGNKKIYKEDYINSIRIFAERTKKNKLSEKEYSVILNELIAEKMYQNFSESLNIEINDKSLAYFIRNNNNFKNKDGIFSRTEYEKFLLINNLNSSIVETEFKKDLLKKLTIDVFTNGVVTTDYHTNQLENEFLKQINASYFKLLNNKISNSEIKEYFNSNKLEFSLGNLRDAEVIQLNHKSFGLGEENDQFYKFLNNLENDLINNFNYNDLKKKYNLKANKTVKLNKIGLNELGEKNNDSIFAKSLFTLDKNFRTEIFNINGLKYLIHFNKSYDEKETKLNSKIEERISKILNYKKNLQLSKNISESKNDDIFLKTANKLNTQVKNIFFSNSLDNKNIFNQTNMEKIFNSKQNQILNIVEKDEVYLLKIIKVSKNKNKIDNLKNILNSQIKLEFQSFILKDLDIYLSKKYPIKINNESLSQIKKSL